MLKQYTNSNLLKEYKETLRLSSLQKEVLIGTILGDGSFKLSRSGKSARLQICHSFSSKDYVSWKWKIFDDWVFCDPKYYKVNNSLIFRTVSHESIFEYMKMFYKGKLKIVPKNITDILKSNLSLAVWFMDDGNGYINKRPFRISTYAFGLRGNILLQNCLKRNFGIQTSIKFDSKGPQLYIPVRNGSADRFKNLIARYIIPSMRYKIEHRSPVETYMEGTR